LIDFGRGLSVAAARPTLYVDAMIDPGPLLNIAQPIFSSRKMEMVTH